MCPSFSKYRGNGAVVLPGSPSRPPIPYDDDHPKRFPPYDNQPLLTTNDQRPTTTTIQNDPRHTTVLSYERPTATTNDNDQRQRSPRTIPIVLRQLPRTIHTLRPLTTNDQRQRPPRTIPYPTTVLPYKRPAVNDNDHRNDLWPTSTTPTNAG